MNINGLSLQQFIAVTENAYMAAANEEQPRSSSAAQTQMHRKLLAQQLADGLDNIRYRINPLDARVAMMFAGILCAYTSVFRALDDKQAENWCRIKAIIITRDWTQTEQCIHQVRERLVARA